MMFDLSPVKELTTEVRALRKEMAILIAILQKLSAEPDMPLRHGIVLQEKEKRAESSSDN